MGTPLHPTPLLPTQLPLVGSTWNVSELDEHDEHVDFTLRKEGGCKQHTVQLKSTTLMRGGSERSSTYAKNRPSFRVKAKNQDFASLRVDFLILSIRKSSRAAWQYWLVPRRHVRTL